jgi:hypothetical protein
MPQFHVQVTGYLHSVLLFCRAKAGDLPHSIAPARTFQASLGTLRFERRKNVVLSE